MVRDKPPTKAAKTSNGSKSAPKEAPPAEIRSPAQPPELTTTQRQRMKEWLKNNKSRFNVTCADVSRKRKRESEDLLVQDDLWDDRLSVQYEVTPRQKWESLRAYRKFTVSSESFALGHCILVSHGPEEDRIDVANQWKAKVLEIRALDPENVFLRVAWLNRPEDLDIGRQAWHGMHELIPTNQMDIIDAMSVNGGLDVVHWNDADEESPLPNDDQYFWRQTYDYVGKSFSELPVICTCSKAINPDKMIIQCSDEACGLWQHVKCIAEKAASEHEKGSTKKANTPKKRYRPKSAAITADTTAADRAESAKKTVTAEVFIKDKPNGPNETPSTISEVVVLGADGQEHAEDLLCLKCSKPID